MSIDDFDLLDPVDILDYIFLFVSDSSSFPPRTKDVEISELPRVSVS